MSDQQVLPPHQYFFAQNDAVFCPDLAQNKKSLSAIDVLRYPRDAYVDDGQDSIADWTSCSSYKLCHDYTQ